MYIGYDIKHRLCYFLFVAEFMRFSVGFIVLLVAVLSVWMDCKLLDKNL